MLAKISHDSGAAAASVEIMITEPLPDYDLLEVEAPVPRDVDPMLASQGFKDLLDEVRSFLEAVLPGSELEIAQLTGAICHDQRSIGQVYGWYFANVPPTKPSRCPMLPACE